MKLSNRTLGIIAMIGAPGLFLEMCNGGLFGSDTSPFDGIFDLMYMTGWMCSILGLIRQQAAGNNKHNIRLLWLNVIFLGFACIWNVMEIFNPANQSLLYHILDCFWPASNMLLFATGIVIVIKGKLKGIDRYAPVIAGFWLLFAFGFGALANGKNMLSFYVIGGYSIAAWFLLGFTIYRSESSISEEQMTYA